MEISDKKTKLRQIIGDFEDRRIDGDIAIALIRDLTGETIDIGYLSEYWASEDLDTFIDKLLVEHIEDWQAIDDMRAVELITEIMQNIHNQGMVIRNSTALERRYGKPSGVVRTMLDHSDQDPASILNELKRETRFFL